MVRPCMTKNFGLESLEKTSVAKLQAKTSPSICPEQLKFVQKLVAPFFLFVPLRVYQRKSNMPPKQSWEMPHF